MPLRWSVCLIAVIVVFGMGFVQQKGDVSVSGPAAIEHVVLCWLDDKNDSFSIQALIDKSKELRAIPGVNFLKTGNVLKSSRQLVDDSFDVGFVLGFDSQKDMESYLDHPTHLSFVKDYLNPILDKVVVYDIQIN